MWRADDRGVEGALLVPEVRERLWNGGGSPACQSADVQGCFWRWRVILYEFQCAICGERHEERRAVVSRDEVAACVSCGAAARRVFGAGVQLSVPFWWEGFSGADLEPDLDEKPEFARKSWPGSAPERPLNNRRRF